MVKSESLLFKTWSRFKFGNRLGKCGRQCKRSIQSPLCRIIPRSRKGHSIWLFVNYALWKTHICQNWPRGGVVSYLWWILNNESNYNVTNKIRDLSAYPILLTQGRPLGFTMRPKSPCYLDLIGNSEIASFFDAKYSIIIFDAWWWFNKNGVFVANVDSMSHFLAGRFIRSSIHPSQRRSLLFSGTANTYYLEHKFVGKIRIRLDIH